jgi:uncharacterized protein YxjI
MARKGGEGDRVDRNTRYRMSMELAALGADFLVLTDAGEHVFRISGRAMSDDDTIRIEDMQGHVLCEASAHLARKQVRVAIVDGAGNEIGSVLRQPVSPLRDRFEIQLHDGLMLAVDGNITTHEFSIVGPPGRVAEISKKWFRARGSYGIEVAPGQTDALLLTTVIVMDLMILGVP